MSGKLYFGDAVIRLRNAGFIVKSVNYGRVRKTTDLHAVKGDNDQTIFGNDTDGTYQEKEIERVIAGLHKYAGENFGGHSFPADAPPNYGNGGY